MRDPGVAMLLGVMAMGGGTTDRWVSMPLMWTRVGLQGLTLMLLTIAAILR